MKRYLTLLGIILIGLNLSCTAKKELVHKSETIKSDTLILKTETIKSALINSSIVIKELCDSITKRPKDYKQVFVVAGDTIKLSIENNQLKLDIKRIESTISEWRDKYQKEYERRLEYDKNVKTIVKTTKWTWIFLMWAIVATVGLVYLLWDKITGWFKIK